MKCVIPCAGRSSRMKFVPKNLVEVNGRPLISHIVDLWEDHVDSFIFVISRSMTYMLEYIPEGSTVVFQDQPLGLADSILRARKCLSQFDNFIVNLGDCLFKGTFEAPKNFSQGLGVWETDDLDEIRKSYLVEDDGGLIRSLTEKPDLLQISQSKTPKCGMGVYFLNGEVFKYIPEIPSKPGGGDFTSVLQKMVDAGESLVPVSFQGKYVNVTSPEDIEKAEKLVA